MIVLPALILALGATQDSVYSGRAGHTSALAVRLDDSVTVDGRLDEPAWGKASRLTGFSQYLPVDQRPAADSTVILVWYSPSAIHFGIRAYESHGEVRATLADRDRINGEDHVQIHLDTYHDGRRTFVFRRPGFQDFRPSHLVARLRQHDLQPRPMVRQRFGLRSAMHEVVGPGRVQFDDQFGERLVEA